MRRLYLAYGSNLSISQISERCPGSKPVAAVSIQGYRLEFAGEHTGRWGKGGVATLIEDGSALAWGALYMLGSENEARMDRFEGVPRSYTKEDGWEGIVKGFALAPGDTIFTYIKRIPRPVTLPSEQYILTILQGYNDWQLPKSALDPWVNRSQE